MKEPQIGKRYKGIGSSGMTDGDPVEGVLTEIVGTYWYVILTRDDGMPCAVNYDSLEEVIGDTKVI